MFRSPMRIVLALLAVAATAGEVRAQCATYSPAPTVAYQPLVAYQPVVAQPRTSWYPGKLWDQLRLRRWGAATPAPTYTAAYAPYSATPYATPHSASYTPYVTAYAPMARLRTVVARPVILQPTYGTYGVASSCCNTCSTGVSQAAFNTPTGSCSSCSTGSFSDGVITGSATPTPELPLNEPTPIKSNFPPTGKTIVKKHTDSMSAEEEKDEEADDSGALLLEVPPWTLPPFGDRAASRSRVNRPSVNVWDAVYRGSPTASSVSHPVSPRRTQAEAQAKVDAEGWQAISR